jgi:hypothetical protein
MEYATDCVRNKSLGKFGQTGFMHHEWCISMGFSGNDFSSLRRTHGLRAGKSVSFQVQIFAPSPERGKFAQP